MGKNKFVVAVSVVSLDGLLAVAVSVVTVGINAFVSDGVSGHWMTHKAEKIRRPQPS